MGLPQPREKGHTLEDWKGWDGRWELIHGEAHPTYGMGPAPSLDHQRVSSSLHAALWNALEKARKQSGGHCEVFAAPLDVFLGESVVQPDLVVVCDPARMSERGIEGAPDLVVEILSPATARKDLVTKRWLYESHGIPEYLILDPVERVADLLVLDAAGRYDVKVSVPWGSALAVLGGRTTLTLA